MDIISVSQINTYIKMMLNDCSALKNIYICGEISNFVHYYKSGHMYLTLKDDKSQIKAVMFQSYASKIKFKPENGMSVICRGSISCYERDGVYQLYIEDMQPDGVGSLTIAFEQLKAKLADEGYFDDSNKMQIPQYPKKIGVVTSNMGAAVEDIKKILKKRYPIAEVVIVPTVVQGDRSGQDIAESINYLNTFDDVDVMIVGRGGGSIEDLWGFNTEVVAKAIFNSNIPIISAVGHETDFTIADFVADVRAATPSNAAEIAVPDMYSELVNIASMRSLMRQNIISMLDNEKIRLDNLSSSKALNDSKSITDAMKNKIDDLSRKLSAAMISKINDKKVQFANNFSLLDSLSPLSVLSRGYSIASKNGASIKTVKDIKSKDSISVRFADGVANCTVNEVINNE